MIRSNAQPQQYSSCLVFFTAYIASSSTQVESDKQTVARRADAQRATGLL